jgi:hypothetical protein
MLATILKSSKATDTTIAIVETFVKVRKLSEAIKKLPNIPDKTGQNALMQKTGELLAEILDDSALEVSGDETTVELNLAVLKIKHTTKRQRKREAQE